MTTTRETVVSDAKTRLHLLVCLSADFDCAYIPHLCRYYTPVVDSWSVLLHSNEHGGKSERVIAGAQRAFESSLADVSSNASLNTRVWRGEFRSHVKVRRLNDMVRELVPTGEWVMYVDADEFVESPDNLKSLLAQCNALQQKVVYGCIVDRFASDKKPYPIHDEDDLFIKFPRREEYTKTAMRGWTHKPCLMKYEGKPLLLNCHDYDGQEWSAYQRSGRPVLTVWHFKWVESTREKLKHRVFSFKRLGIGWWKESAICLNDIYEEETARLRNAPDDWPDSADLASNSWRPRRLGTVHELDGVQALIQLDERGVQLNPTATLIWELCDGAHTEAEILAELCELFGAPEDLLRRDLRDALSELFDAGALEPESKWDLNPLSGKSNTLRLHLGLVAETSDRFLNQVKLCLFSLRKNGGALGNLPVTLITNSESLNDREAEFLKEHFSPIEFKTSPRLGAIPHASKLNVFYSIDPSTYDVLMFMDCDTVVRQPLDRIVDPIVNEGAQFVCRRGGETDRNRFVDFNALVTRFCGPERTNKILYEGLKEWPMFNSGVFLATSEAVCKIRRASIEFTYQIFNDWLRNHTLENLPEEIKSQINFKQEVLENWPIEQGALALACINSGVKVQYLDGTYNSWGGEEDFHILHCFKSLYKFDRRVMFSSDSESWIAEYIESDIPGKNFLASIVREYKQEHQRDDYRQDARNGRMR